MKTIMVIWKFDDFGVDYLIEAEDIETKMLLGDYSVIIEGVNVGKHDFDELLEKYEKYQEVNADELYNSHVEDLAEFFKSIGEGNVDTSVSEYYEEPRDVLIYNQLDHHFYNLKDDGQEVQVYEWWDGSTRKIVERNDEFEVTEVLISDENLSLDENDGQNYVTGGVGLHQDVYVVFEIDGKKVKDTFMVKYWSQWQGSHPRGEIMKRHELQDHLQSIERDVPEYMYSVGKLLGE